MGFRSGQAHRGWQWAVALLIIVAQLVPASASHAAGPSASTDNGLGIDFVSAAGKPAADTAPLMSNQRYDEAAGAGAGWDRWVIYWQDVETSPGQYNWSGVDPVANGDAARNLNVDAILLGTPSFYATTATTTLKSQGLNAPYGGLRALTSTATTAPAGLEQPTFADGTDYWTPGKAINQNNHWAKFVNTAVARYHNQIHYWEIWNEPDFSQFWAGSIDQYVRLLKVAYLAAHAADDSAKIMVGGMMYWEWANAYGDQSWLKQFLSQVADDPEAPANGYYFDVIPWHWYSRSSDVYWKTLSAESVLSSFGIAGKEVWINETNVPACNEPAPHYANCNDYPGGTNPSGTWATNHATIDEQASYMIQAIAYGFAAGATHVFEFQLQDDGNVDAYGMFRNDGSARPIYQAYKLAVQNVAGFATVHRYSANGAEWVTFGVPGPNPHRTTVLWNDTDHQVIATVAAAGSPPSGVSLVQQNGTTQGIGYASSYNVSLAPATDNRNGDNPWQPSDYIIGGPTVFLVENLPADSTPPTSRASASLSSTSQGDFDVKWSGTDSGGWGVFDYTIQYRDLTAHGYWANWQTNTMDTSGTFAPTQGHQYEFRSLARDWAGNVETKCPGQSDTTISALAASLSSSAASSGPYHYYLPLVAQQAGIGC